MRRLVDIVVALVALAALSPLLAAISPAICDLESGVDMIGRLGSLLSQRSAMFAMDRRHGTARVLLNRSAGPAQGEK